MSAASIIAQWREASLSYDCGERVRCAPACRSSWGRGPGAQPPEIFGKFYFLECIFTIEFTFYKDDWTSWSALVSHGQESIYYLVYLHYIYLLYWSFNNLQWRTKTWHVISYSLYLRLIGYWLMVQWSVLCDRSTVQTTVTTDYWFLTRPHCLHFTYFY